MTCGRRRARWAGGSPARSCQPTGSSDRGVEGPVATASLWIGAELAKRIEWLLPCAAGISILMISGGFLHEWWRSGRPGPPKSDTDTPPPTASGAPED